MTLIVATKRENFAVLAADRLHGGVSLQCAPKVVCHPDTAIPIAFAIAGCSSLCLKGKPAPSTEHVLDFAKEVVSANDLELELIAARLERRVCPGVEKARLAMQIFIALVRNGKASVGVQCFDFKAGKLAANLSKECLRILPPKIEPAYQIQDWNSLHDPAISDPGAIVGHARMLVEKGIAYERSLNSGENKWCGGGVEVVLVTSTGARLV